MGDSKKSQLADDSIAAKLASGLRFGLSSPHIAVGLPAGVRVQTNAQAVVRFPLPLTIGAALIAALGVVAAYKGHKKTGVSLVVIGALGLGVAAAAPEINSALANVGAP